jgi:PAS domain S-box-containing protein
MLTDIAVKVIELGIALNSDDFMTLAGISMSLVSIALLIVYYLLQRQIRERRQAEIFLQQQTKRERIVNQIAQHIRQSLNLEEVLATTVAEVRQFLECDRVLIYRIWSDGTGSAITETVLTQYPAILGETFPAEVFPSEYHQAYTRGKIGAITDVDQGDIALCLAEFVKQFRVKAKLVVPIIQEIRELNSSSPYLWGLLIAHQCSQSRQWQYEEIELMKQLATQVAIAIQQSEFHEQLQQLNAQLEQRVQQRTEELALSNDFLREEIAERQRTEAALRHTNQTLQSLIAASPRAIFTLDLTERVKIWNPAAERMFGWTEAEVIERPNPIISQDVSEYEAIKQSLLQGITPPSLEIRRQKKDGSPIDIVFSAAPLTDSSNKINGIVAVVSDVTEQKRQAEQVRLLQSVVVNTNDAIVITEPDPINQPGPRILYVNEAFTRITGYTLEEVLGKTPRLLQGAKTSQAELDKVRSALALREAIIVEVINYRKNGAEFWSEFSVVPVADKTGQCTHWISVQRDITERKRLDEVRLALEQEKELSALKTRFFSMASHEFRTPLSTVLAAAQLLENSPPDNSEKRLRNLRRIQDSVKNMIQLLDDILTINRAETGKLEFNPKPLALENFCRQFVEEMQMSAGNQHTLIFVSQGKCTHPYLDEKLLRSILGNFLSNAIKYSPRGSQIHCFLKFELDCVRLQIRDHGIGIPPDDQKQLFEPFYRGKNVRHISGTGLGLVVVKKCVDLHGGNIEIASYLGQGTTVTIILPINGRARMPTPQD